MDRQSSASAGQWDVTGDIRVNEQIFVMTTVGAGGLRVRDRTMGVLAERADILDAHLGVGVGYEGARIGAFRVMPFVHLSKSFRTFVLSDEPSISVRTTLGLELQAILSRDDDRAGIAARIGYAYLSMAPGEVLPGDPPLDAPLGIHAILFQVGGWFFFDPGKH